jgi:hypothetical protein
LVQMRNHASADIVVRSNVRPSRTRRLMFNARMDLLPAAGWKARAPTFWLLQDHHQLKLLAAARVVLTRTS